MDTQYMKILERLKTRHLLTSSAVDFLARTSALLEKAQELRAAGLDYGGTCTELSEKSDPIMSLSKIALCLESEDSSPCNRFFGSPTYRGNYHEYIRDGVNDGTYPNPELSEALMSFPISWTETDV